MWSAPYTVKDATWEPIESFIMSNGWLNEIFIDYCKEKRLDEIMSIAEKKAARAREKQPIALGSR